MSKKKTPKAPKAKREVSGKDTVLIVRLDNRAEVSEFKQLKEQLSKLLPEDVRPSWSAIVKDAVRQRAAQTTVR